MKKRIIIALAVCLLAQAGWSQKSTTVKSIKLWNITDKTATVVPTTIDTSLYNFPNEDPMNNYSIANAYNGSLGSPLQSKIYFDRTEKTDFLFSRPYDAYFIAPTDVLFYNTKTPYTNLTYNSNGGQLTHEDDFKALFSLNINKRLNFSGLFNYVRTLGMYDEQQANQVKGGIWSSYFGRYYAYNAIVMYQAFNNMENGGITNEEIIRNPNKYTGYETYTIPTNLTGVMSRYTNFYAYYNHKLHLASVKHIVDSNKVEYRPIASLCHTFKYEIAQKRYLSTNSDSAYYVSSFYNTKGTLDSTRYSSLRNTVAFSINEGFSRWFPMSLIGYLENDYRQYYTNTDSIGKAVTASENNVLMGAEMSKRQGKHLLFNGNGEIYITGPQSGDFHLNGGVSSSFRLFSDTVSVEANGFLKNTTPSYYERNYFSNHFEWANSFDRTTRTHLDGKLGLHNKWMDIVAGAGVEYIANYIYFNENAVPAQYDQTIQVVTGTAEVNFNLWVLHLQNKAVYQHTSDDAILPLPELSIYSNVFFAFKLFKKVLGTQIGANMYYNTAYYAPSYMPATGAFYLQTKEKIGDYPLMSAYLNFHLKTARFFFKYYHINKQFSNNNYFSMPNYPLYPERFKMGISWNFFD